METFAMGWRLAAAAVLGLLAGCVERGAETAGWPEVVAERAAGFEETGEAGVPVQAVARGLGAAADCTLVGAGFRAAFAAPAVVRVPTRGRESGRVRVDCAGADGRGAVVAGPVVQRTDGLGGWPAIGMGVTSGGDAFARLGGWWSGEPGGVAVLYPSIEVVLQ